MPSTTAIDLHWNGRPHSVAAALLEAGGLHAIIDPGPASTLDTLRAELRSRGLSVADLETIFLTHIHLDHAGGVGDVARAFPAATVYVHEKGARHLADPSRLIDSAS